MPTTKIFTANLRQCYIHVSHSFIATSENISMPANEYKLSLIFVENENALKREIHIFTVSLSKHLKDINWTRNHSLNIYLLMMSKR